MLTKLDLNNIATLHQILDIQKVSYQIEANRIGFYDIPTLKDTLDDIRDCGECFYGYYEADILAGFLSYRIQDRTLDIHRVAVHPEYFRRGIAQKLLCHIEGLEDGINKIVVSTGKENLPAVKLYQKNGFVKINELEISQGIFLSEFEKLTESISR